MNTQILKEIITEIESKKFIGIGNEDGGYDIPEHQANFNSGLICAINIIREYLKESA